MIKFYFDKYVRTPASGAAPTINVDGVTEEDFVEAAQRTVGFSGREISKLAIAWQSAAYGTANARFDPDLMRSVLESHVAQKALKSTWLHAAEDTASHRQQAYATS